MLANGLKGTTQAIYAELIYTMYEVTLHQPSTISYLLKKCNHVLITSYQVQALTHEISYLELSDFDSVR